MGGPMEKVDPVVDPDPDHHSDHEHVHEVDPHAENRHHTEHPDHANHQREEREQRAQRGPEIRPQEKKNQKQPECGSAGHQLFVDLCRDLEILQ